VTAAVTIAPAAAHSGQGPADAGRQADQDEAREGRSATAARPVPAGGAAALRQAGETGRTVVPAPRPPFPAAVISGAAATTSAAALRHLSPQVAAAALGDRQDSSGQGEPAWRGTRRRRR
jgi:hypothetical protein